MRIQLSDERMDALKNGFHAWEYSKEEQMQSIADAKRNLKLYKLYQFYDIIDMVENFAYFPFHMNFWEGKYGHAVPSQGWKMHVSIKTVDEYYTLLTVMIPFLNELDCVYKVVNPTRFKYFSMERGGKQAGKYITIYLGTKEKFEQFILSVTDNLFNLLLMDNGVPVDGEIHIAGRMYARYGAFTDPKYLLDPFGNIVEDVRGNVCPPWVDENELADVLKVRRSML